jgi:type IV fimbrial biogenesis protein FimT
MSKNQKAFTIVELLVTIAVFGVVLALAIPSFNQSISNNRSVTVAEEFADALKYARAEAMKTSSPITLCPLDEKSVNDETDDVCGDDWHKGWLVIRDAATGVAADPVVANNNAILRRWAKTDANFIYNFTPERTYIRFAALGVLSRDKGVNTAVVKVYLNNCKGDSARTITVGLSGMMQVERTACSTL